MEADIRHARALMTHAEAAGSSSFDEIDITGRSALLRQSTSDASKSSLQDKSLFLWLCDIWCCPVGTIEITLIARSNKCHL